MQPDPPPSTSDGRASENLRFARLLGALALVVLALAAFLLALPSIVGGPPIVYLIAYGIGALFGPIGFTLLAASWRLRNQAIHGTALPTSQRRGLGLLGGALVVVGLFLVFSGFGVSGSISRVLNVVWGISLSLYGVRFLVRSLLADRA